MADFDTGRQVRLDIIRGGEIVDSATLTQFSSKQETIDLKHRPIRGRSRHKTIYDGWSGSFSLDRDGPTWDDYFASEEEAYYAGLGNAQVTIQETIDETDGSVSQYLYEGVTMKFVDAGDKTQDKQIVQKVDFMATGRTRLV